MPRRSAAFTVFCTSSLTTVAWNDAAMSATSRSASGWCRLTYSDTAVFSPLNEKSGAWSVICATGNGIALGAPARAVFSIKGPPGKPRPRSLATLSKASPAASSRVWPTREYESGATA